MTTPTAGEPDVRAIRERLAREAEFWDGMATNMGCSRAGRKVHRRMRDERLEIIAALDAATEAQAQQQAEIERLNDDVEQLQNFAKGLAEDRDALKAKCDSLTLALTEARKGPNEAEIARRLWLK